MKLIHTCTHATQFGILATAVYEEGEMTDDKRGTDTTYFVVSTFAGPTFFLFHHENYAREIMIVLIGLYLRFSI